MWGIIERLRTKSETYRKGFAFGTALVMTLMIFGVWVTVLFPNVISPKKILADNINIDMDIPTGSFKANLAQSFSAVKFQWNSFSEYFSQTKYEAPAELEVAVPERNRNIPNQKSTATQSHFSD